MRDAFGGAFMIKLLIVFIIIYVGFTAIALNYAKAFKVKNKIIEYIEDNELFNIDSMSAADKIAMENFIDTAIVGEMNYKMDIACPDYSGDPILEVEYCDRGVLIVKVKPRSNERNKLGNYHRVTTVFGWNIPFLNKLLELNNQTGEVGAGYWTVSGETRSIVNE